jgi:hypothetical protein
MTLSEPSENVASATVLVEAVADAIPGDAVIAVAGELHETGALDKILVPLELGSWKLERNETAPRK